MNMIGAKNVCFVGAVLWALASVGRPVPSPALLERLDSGPDLIGIVHWGLNTYTDREWGYGDEDPARLNPGAFDADAIVAVCRAGGLGGLVVVAKHHDGFCLWPTKTTEYNITKTPFWKSRGADGRDYVKEMSEACAKAGLKFGVYVSPWDRNSADYGEARYVETYHAQIKELLSGGYGEVFEMWFDGANGGDGWYGGAKERRIIPNGYYRFNEIFAFVRRLQPRICIFAGESDDSEFRWPGNERGELDPDSRATVCDVGGFANGKYGNPDYACQINTGNPDGTRFRVCEADFPLRKGWFYHASDSGMTKHAAYLMKCYLRTVGNGGTMNLGIAPDREGRIDAEDTRALEGFGAILRAFFADEVTEPGREFNFVVLSEDISKGEQVDCWTLLGDGGSRLAGGRAIGRRRMRVFDRPVRATSVKVNVSASGPDLGAVTVRRYYVDPELVRMVMSSTAASGETDTAKWMTGQSVEKKK